MAGLLLARPTNCTRLALRTSTRSQQAAGRAPAIGSQFPQRRQCRQRGVQAGWGRKATDWAPPPRERLSWESESDYDSDEDLDLFPEEVRRKGGSAAQSPPQPWQSLPIVYTCTAAFVPFPLLTCPFPLRMQMNGDPEFVAENVLALVLLAVCAVAASTLALKLLIVSYSLVAAGIRYTVVGLFLAVMLVQVQPGRWWY